MFLEIITRTFGKRPQMLARNQASLAAQSSADWGQRIVIDDQGRGCTWANRNLATVTAVGDYVWVLDDDDYCARQTLVAELQALAPFDICMLRAEHAVFGTLPRDENWCKPPVLGDIGSSNYVISRDVWGKHHRMFAEWPVYWADYEFIAYLWRQNLNVCWHNVTAAIYPQRSQGAAEDAR